MFYAYHDTRNLIFRNPFGACPVSTHVTLCLFCNEKAHVCLQMWTGDNKYVYDTSCKPFCFHGIHGFMYSCDVILPSCPGLVFYNFRIEHENTYFYCTRHGEGKLCDNDEYSAQITVYIPRTLPSWYKHGIMYQIFPDRFSRGGGTGGLSRISSHTNRGQRIFVHENWDDDVISYPINGDKYYCPRDFFCGDLYGIAEKLPYLDTMHISGIYLNPVFVSPSNHRYDTSDYMHIDGILGGDTAFYELLSECIKHNCHLMLDGVFSHTGADSIYFNKYKHFGEMGAYNSKDSRFYDWYSFIDYPNLYNSWWGFDDLPEVDEDNSTYQEYICEVARKWCVSWRLDVADELTDNFLYRFYNEAKSTDKDAVVIGEVWEDASDKHSKGHRRPYTDGTCLDGVMNYPLRSYITGFITGEISACEFVEKVMVQKENYPPEFLCGCLNILSSHDTERIMTVLDNGQNCRNLTKNNTVWEQFCGYELTYRQKKVILAMIVQFTADGVPCIYYGDEQCMTGGKDPFSRRPFHICKDNCVYEVLCKICAVHSHKAFSGSAKYSVYDGVLVIERKYGDSYVYAVVNAGEGKPHIEITTDFSGSLVCAISGNVYHAVNNKIDITVEGGAYLYSV